MVLQGDFKINGKAYYGYLFNDGLLLCAITNELKEAKRFISAKLALANNLDDILPGFLLFIILILYLNMLYYNDNYYY